MEPLAEASLATNRFMPLAPSCWLERDIAPRQPTASGTALDFPVNEVERRHLQKRLAETEGSITP